MHQNYAKTDSIFSGSRPLWKFHRSGRSMLHIPVSDFTANSGVRADAWRSTAKSANPKIFRERIMINK